MENQFRLLTQRALGALGAVMRKRSIAGDDGTIPMADLIVEMNGELPAVDPLVEGVDFIIRGGVANVRFMTRNPNRLDILLPEANIINALAADMQNGSATVHAPWPHTNYNAPAKRYYVQAAGYSPAISSRFNGEYDIEIDDDGFRVFLDPYMAGYVTTQCI